MPFYKVCVNRTMVNTYVIKAENKSHAFNRVRQGKAFPSDSTKLNGDDIAVIEINEEDGEKWFDMDNKGDIYFELTDGIWISNIYKKEIDKDLAEKWGKDEDHNR